MITVTARLLKNDMILNADGVEYSVRPTGWDTGGIRGALQRHFTLKYEVFDHNETMVSTVRYNDLRDEIHIQRGEKKYNTSSEIFKPAKLVFQNRKLEIHEKLTGVIYITHNKEIIANGICGFKSVKFVKYDDGVKDILRDLAVGYCIKILAWEMYL